MKLYKLMKKKWHYLKWVLLMRREISNGTKRSFYSFGDDSSVSKPVRQLSGIENVKIGTGTTILEGARVAVYGEENKGSVAIEIGDGCYIGYGFTVLGVASGKISIGNDVLVASNVLVTNENHGMDPESETPYMNQALSCQNVEIGNGCWIGEKVCILPGVTIGEKSIIGAGSVVTGNIPKYCLAVGNPARVIKRYNFTTHMWEKI